MFVMGVDISTFNVDCVKVSLNDEPPQWHRFPLAGADAFDRARSVRDSMPGRTTEFFDDLIGIGIEDPRGHGAGHIYRVQGAVLSCLPPHLLVHPLIPSAWRKLTGLKGNADKWQIAFASEAMLQEHYPDGFEDWPQDAHDAHFIARATLALLTTFGQKQAA